MKMNKLGPGFLNPFSPRLKLNEVSLTLTEGKYFKYSLVLLSYADPKETRL